MQKRAARTITGFNYETRPKTIFRRIGWSPLEKILTKRELLITFEAIRGAAPEYVCNIFTNCDNAVHQTRSYRRKLHLDKPDESFMKKSFSYRGTHYQGKF